MLYYIFRWSYFFPIFLSNMPIFPIQSYILFAWILQNWRRGFASYIFAELSTGMEEYLNFWLCSNMLFSWCELEWCIIRLEITGNYIFLYYPFSQWDITEGISRYHVWLMGTRLPFKTHGRKHENQIVVPLLGSHIELLSLCINIHLIHKCIIERDGIDYLHAMAWNLLLQ